MSETARVRIDKWLWAARFFKTRALAAEAVDGGKVHLNDHRVKRSRAVRTGDQVEVWRGQDRYLVIVEAVSSRRGPAREAQLLYQETTESIERREEAAAMRRLEFAASRPSRQRPSGRDRQKIRSFTGKG